MKLSAQLTDRPSFMMQEDQGLFQLLTVVDELHGSVLRVFTTSSAEPLARSMNLERPLLFSGLHFFAPSKTIWQISQSDRSFAPNPLGLGSVCSATSHGLARI